MNDKLCINLFYTKNKVKYICISAVEKADRRTIVKLIKENVETLTVGKFVFIIYKNV